MTAGRSDALTATAVKVTARGAGRWKQGHPWIYRSDVAEELEKKPGIVPVTDRKGKFLGKALYSPSSEIRLRLLTRADEPVDAAWWTARIRDAAERRAGITASAWRAVHAEADGMPSLVIDKYGPYVVAQLLSAGLETARADVLAAIGEVFGPDGVLLRNDAAVRRHEGLPAEVVLVSGQVPEVVEVTENGIKYLAAPWSGQKTGAFLDQRENRQLVGQHTRPGGRALDLFTYHGSFALYLARAAKAVLAVDQSTEALERGAENARLNAIGNIEWREGNAFDLLRDLERRREQFDTIVLDPPAFAKTKANLERAIAGYKEVNLRAMKILAPRGVLFTSSCSYHVSRDIFNAMLTDAARDSGRRIQFLAATGASSDHPELLNVPETGYLKGVLLRVRE
ncbi:MAG TPA: class I SAM-dependent rRNA methyltransferase [Gemmatimonadales bacterium]|nr:class I SAM-dependent rRNA methyltransferase [Gemmatimonadales bacterium]